jgi:FMN-dependent oxidoreductase (nitrilotriacetate monooxygenase family)
MRTDKMILAAFGSASATLGSVGAWTHLSSDLGLLDADYYINLGRTCERVGFDILFFDDRLAMPAAYGDSVAETARLGSRALKLDIATILALISSHTNRIGLGATYSTTYYQPYHVARLFATLDHLSGGRAVWNIVTSLNSAEADNFGAAYSAADDRYDRADEFLEIVTGLWGTWKSESLKLDRNTKTFADPKGVAALDYEGRYLSSRGPLTVPQPPQHWPVLLQAGQSGRGMDFAGRWADLIFTAPRDLETARQHYRKQAACCENAGRAGQAGRILPAIQVIVGETEAIAKAKNAYFESLESPEEELIAISEQANFDFSTLPMDEPLPADLLDRIQGARGLVERYLGSVRAAHGPDATLRQLAHNQARNSINRFVGDPSQVADQMAEWFSTRASDGFAVLPTSDPTSFEDFGRLVIPELRNRALVAEPDDSRQTLRHRLGLADRG